MNTAQANALWAIEIEQSTVSTIWRQPERCAEFLRECDPVIHLTQPNLRIILDAINLSYGELGSTDWALVVETVRELGKFDETGGLEGLNAVYTATEITPVTDQVFKHYVEMLKTYAEHRASDPPRSVHTFTGGKASLSINKNKRRPNDPDYLGQARVRGHNYQIRGWLGADSESVNITFEPQ